MSEYGPASTLANAIRGGLGDIAKELNQSKLAEAISRLAVSHDRFAAALARIATVAEAVVADHLRREEG